MIEKLCRIPGDAIVPDERTISSFARSVQIGDAGFVTSEALGGRAVHRTGDEIVNNGSKTFSDGIRTNRIIAPDGAAIRFTKRTYASSVYGALSMIVRRKDIVGLIELVRNFGHIDNDTASKLYDAEGAMQSIVEACDAFEEGNSGMTIARAYGIVASALVGAGIGDTDETTARSVSKKFFRELVSNFEEANVAASSSTSLPALVLRTASICDRIKNVQNELGRMPKDFRFSFPAINSQKD